MTPSWLRQRRRVPIMLQMSATECGAACLAMVFSSYRRWTSVAECREQLGIGRDGATALQMTQLARRTGMRARGVSVDLEGLPQLRLPAIVHWNFRHYLVLERWDRRGAVVVDPGMGRRRMSREEFGEGFTGIAIELTPGEEFERRPSPGRLASLRFARSMLTFSRPLLGLVLVVSLLLQLAVLLPALITKFAVDTVIGKGQVEALTVLGLGMLLLLATQGVGTYARGVALNVLHARMDDTMMRRFFDHLLALPYSYFQLRSSGDLLMRMSSNTVIRDLVTSQTMSLVLDGLFVVVYIGMLLAFTPLYAWLVLGLGLLQLGAIVATYRAMRERTHRDIAAQAEEQNYAVEVLAGAETVKAMGAEQQVLGRWSGLFQTRQFASLHRRQLETGLEATLGVFRMGSPLLLLWVGAHQVVAGAMSLGTMLALNALAAAVLTPLMGLVNTARQLQTVGTHLERIRDVMDEAAEQDRSTSQPPGRISGQVTLSGVGMRYSANAAWAVRGVDLSIPAGAKVALVGRTGSGKTTLAKTIIGLYVPSEGEVRFDGRLLQDLDFRELRRWCGMVTQEPALFAGSVRDNISLGHPSASYDEVVLAAERAQIHDEIMAMPMAYETRLTEGGGGLSGGQRQRLALARALVHNPPLLLLDEATSHLDVVTERRVDDILSALSCTRIVIAHRLSTVLNADLIGVMEEGSLVEQGTHDELIAHGRYYEALIRDQLQTARPL
ncbi:peptidase domain-containing ABC transporter [Micromonospora sp. NBC_00362]|uniref:peptidase domain-containing ABC transporter n=1 Tax=Micromonospora sp. NBC_00362 TaxID=2975975 RepID=UPI00225712B8|nr:peptidase domain-containing ABC transporter [Micromonospora sp. NBC_00362]MCX5115779.1 peptidase domain-containing ABC transporter [Micromonospora sp. NBC_00362]